MSIVQSRDPSVSAPYVLNYVPGPFIHFVNLNDIAAETQFAKYLYSTNTFGTVTVYGKDISSHFCWKSLRN